VEEKKTKLQEDAAAIFFYQNIFLRTTSAHVSVYFGLFLKKYFDRRTSCNSILRSCVERRLCAMGENLWSMSKGFTHK